MSIFDAPLYVVPTKFKPAVHRPGVKGSCKVVGCPHTWDWRAAPGSPENLHGVRPDLRRIVLRDVLEVDYRSEAHFATYQLSLGGVPLDPQPRVAKDSLLWLRERGYELHMLAFTADWDTPGHVEWTPELFEQFLAIWQAARGPLATCGVYRSPKGARLIQPLARPIVVDVGERMLLAWLEGLVAAGGPPDLLKVKDFTRLMRTARYRGPKGPVRETWNDFSRVVLIEPPPVPELEPAALRPPRRVSQARTAEKRAAKESKATPVPSGAVPAGWDAVADELGAAIRDHVASGYYRDCYLALSGALCSALAERWVSLAAVPPIIARAHMVDPAWAEFLPDREGIAQSTVERYRAGDPVTGYPYLQTEHPRVAEALDRALVTLDASKDSPTAVRVRAQLEEPAAPMMPLDEAVATIEQEIREAKSLTVIACPPGTGKTQALIRHANSLPPIPMLGRARPGQRIGYVAPTHALIRQVISQARAYLWFFSPVGYTDANGVPICKFVGPGRHLANGGQSIKWEFCEGRNKNPCAFRGECSAAEGLEGDDKANLVVGPDALCAQVSDKIGVCGTLVLDEPGEPLFSEPITLDDLETAERYLDVFEYQYRVAIRPALVAFTEWVRRIGPEPDDDRYINGTPLTTLPDMIRAGASSVSDEVLEAAGIDPTSADLGTLIIAATVLAITDEDDRGVIQVRRRPPPMKPQEPRIAMKNDARAEEAGRASRVLHLLRKGLLGLENGIRHYAGRINVHRKARAVNLIGQSESFEAAMMHAGPRVVLDANAVLLLPVLRFMCPSLRFVDINVPDGAPIRRTIIATQNATYTRTKPDEPDWNEVVPLLRAALAWLAEDPSTKVAALFCPKEIETGIALALRPDAPATQELVRSSQSNRATLTRAAALLRPVLSTWAGELLTGHYRALRGRDDWKHADATITLVDPRPHIGVEQEKALYLGVELGDYCEAKARAELQQAQGRGRTIHRSKPGRQLHVGALVPWGWQGRGKRAVEVRGLPAGRPKNIAAMEAEELTRIRQEFPEMSLRAFAKRLDLSHSTVLDYENGTTPIPAPVAARARRLVPGWSENPCTEVSLFVGVSRPVSVNFPGNAPTEESSEPLIGVSRPVPLNRGFPTSAAPPRRVMGADEPTDADQAEVAGWLPGGDESDRGAA